MDDALIRRSRVRALALAAVPLLAALGCSESSAVVGAMPDVVTDDTPDVAPTEDVPALDAPDVPALDVPALDARDVPPGSCLTNADCAGNPNGSLTCDTAMGRCVQCLPSSDQCPPAQHCDTMSFTCVPGCRSDEGCAAGVDGGTPTRCDTANHTCVECVRDDQCPAGRVCTRSACVPGCNETRPCPSGETCCAGACARLSDNQANCGACGTRCNVANGVAACVAGACAVGTCTMGFADCNNMPADGCESSLNNDTAHCGACGTACPTPPNSESAFCLLGRCDFICRNGFANCDSDAANGCEAQFATDPRNCGACGTACPTPPNAAPACVGGRCGAACAMGFGDCDGNAMNGCELALGTAVNHCGRCGNACPVRPNATPTCAMGACGFACNPGFADCDGDPANGCEVSLTTSLSHCGRCGNACATPPNTTGATCASERCGYNCRAPYVDCDGEAGNGCEVDPLNSPAHCGGCGRACPTPANARATCAGGSCGYACNPGFGDCDGNPANGCETDLNTTAGNCGRCGNACSAPGGTPACSMGACTIASCGGAFADCDTNVSNGCETDTRSSAEHCGRCGNACPVRPNAVPACVASGCLNVCSAGYGECDGLVTNGCETNLATSLAHCGGCGRACSPANATGACMSSTCAIAACNTGFADCDGNAGNGCEVDLRSTVTSCGACGTVCSSPNGTPGCRDGVCQLAACDTNFANCDGNGGNGCEVDLRVSTLSCGACGRACSTNNATSRCTDGACQIASCAAGFADCNGNPADGCEVNLATNVNHCGACNARPNEVCDGRDNDCDGLSDEGCPTGITGLTTLDFQSATWGGGGGGAYDMTCPNGQFVRGVYGGAGSLLDRLGAICGTPRFVEDRSVIPFRYSIVIDPAADVGPVGGGGGGAYRYQCPGNSLVARVLGRSGSYLDQFRVECYAWEITGDPVNGFRIIRSASQGLSGAYGGGGGSPFDYVCPSAGNGTPSAVRRFFGGAGGYVDRLTTNCTWPVLTVR